MEFILANSGGWFLLGFLFIAVIAMLISVVYWPKKEKEEVDTNFQHDSKPVQLPSLKEISKKNQIKHGIARKLHENGRCVEDYESLSLAELIMIYSDLGLDFLILSQFLEIEYGMSYSFEEGCTAQEFIQLVESDLGEVPEVESGSESNVSEGEVSSESNVSEGEVSSESKASETKSIPVEDGPGMDEETEAKLVEESSPEKVVESTCNQDVEPERSSYGDNDSGSDSGGYDGGDCGGDCGGGD